MKQFGHLKVSNIARTWYLKILLREALLTFVRWFKTRVFVRPCVRVENIWFLLLVDEPTTRAPGQCGFGNLILKVPEKKLQKVKLSFTTGLFGTNFGTRFWRTFGATLTKTSPVPITVWAACEWVQSDCSRMWRGSDVTCVGWLAASAGVPLMFLSFALPALQGNI